MMRIRFATIAFVLLSLSVRVEAHNPDTSYVRFKVAPEALETRFTYDLFSLVRIVPALDADGNQEVSRSELMQQAPRVFDYLEKHVRLEIDGQMADFGEPQPVEFPPGVGDAIAEKDYHAATSLVHFAFRKRLEKPARDFWVLFEVFRELGNRHGVLGAIEHDGQEQEVVFRYFEPDYLYDIGFASAHAMPAPVDSAEVPAAAVASAPISTPPDRTPARSNTQSSLWPQLASFFRLGVEHIFLGYDHILFLLSLIVVSRLGDLVKIVTSFTVAHTITLILATLEVVELPSRLVETAIAATIVYVALENFWIEQANRRWVLTFFFGLVHGFGFAGVLRELGLPTVGLVRSLLSFNVGVEAGQLAIVAVLFPAAAAMSKWRYVKQGQRVISGAIALCGLCWFVDRVFGLGFMPF
jgi:hypothetical protein